MSTNWLIKLLNWALWSSSTLKDVKQAAIMKCNFLKSPRCRGGHDLETRERILASAKKEFAEKGFSGARMSEIAKRAKANQAMIHYYFSTKDALYEEILMKMFEVEKHQAVPDFISDTSLTPSQGLYLAIYFIVNSHCESMDVDFNRIMAMEIASGRKFLKSFVKKYFIPKMHIFEEIILKGIRNGEFATTDPMLFIFNIISFVHFYEFNREMYIDTSLHEKVYGGDHKERILNFVLTNSFKAISSKCGVEIPEIPEKIMKSIDDILEKMKEER